MSSIETRIAALALALERRRMEQAIPVDRLSQSLFDFKKELAGLDELGKSDLLAELNTGGLDLSMEDLERFIADWGRRKQCPLFPG